MIINCHSFLWKKGWYSTYEELLKAIAIKKFSESLWLADYSDSSGDYKLAKLKKKQELHLGAFQNNYTKHFTAPSRTHEFRLELS